MLNMTSMAISKQKFVFNRLMKDYGYSEAHLVEDIIPQYGECIREALELGYPIDAITNMVQEKVATGEL